jgi:NAD(P)H-hydrate repair Nnr-like enzyme with NAD(P)H-hydrate epimerase domain
LKAIWNKLRQHQVDSLFIHVTFGDGDNGIDGGALACLLAERKKKQRASACSASMPTVADELSS